MLNQLYMVVEHFKNKDAVSVYRRFRERGRMAPDGLAYRSSWVDHQFERCYQVMEADNQRQESTFGSSHGFVSFVPLLSWEPMLSTFKRKTAVGLGSRISSDS
jgi:hypothetical protein